MERFLLLWDELDELVGLGWHFAAGLTHSMARRVRRTQRQLPSPVADQA